MPLSDLPSTFTVPTRQQIKDRWLRDYKLRQPNADTSAGTQPDIDGSVVTDTILPIYGDAATAGNNADLTNKTSAGLETEAKNLGLPGRLPAAGGTGFVTATASTGGGLITAGTEIRDELTGYRFSCAVSAVYQNLQPVPIQGTDTGPGTNLPAGTTLKWTSPPLGIGPSAVILADPNGKGLTGGRDPETDPELIIRITDARANPAASGNSAALRRFVKEGAKALGIPVQECFVYPALQGPGSTAYVFTLRPGTPGASRVPNSVQIAQILAHVLGELPYDDGVFACAIVEQGQTIQTKIQWAQGATGWADAAPWPPTGASVTAVTDSTHFTVSASAAPQAGQTFGFYNTTTATFVRKRILSFTGVGPYVITCDTTNNASDTSYTPAVSELLCPWSDSLQALVTPLLTQMGTLGPGEMVAAPYLDAGRRQKRTPPSPDVWPSVLRNKDLELAFGSVPQVADVLITSPTLPYQTPVGSPNVSANLLVVSKLLAFPLT